MKENDLYWERADWAFRLGKVLDNLEELKLIKSKVIDKAAKDLQKILESIAPKDKDYYKLSMKGD